MFRTTDRIVSSIPYPITTRLHIEDVYRNGVIDCNLLINFFYDEGRLDEECAIRILRDAANVLRFEPNLLRVDPPVNICGDVHGQFYDLISIFKGCGKPPDVKYLFLGDYVDRGYFGIEIVLLLFAFKIKFPHSMYLLRGNHESRAMTEIISFMRECEVKYSKNVYDECMLTFDCLPLAAVVGNVFLCVHGGIGPHLKFLHDINRIYRFMEIPDDGTFCDLMWADPWRRYNVDMNIPDFMYNVDRNISFYFSYEACCRFLERNNLLTLIRAHSAVAGGYKAYRVTKKGAPSVLTIFSAPAYVSDNDAAAVLEFDSKKLTAAQFTVSPQPYYLPNFENAISYTLPFVVLKISEIFYAILKYVTSSEVDNEELLMEDRNAYVLRSKIQDFGRATSRLARQTANSMNLMKLGSLANVNYSRISDFHNLQAEFGETLSNCADDARSARLLETLNQAGERWI